MVHSSGTAGGSGSEFGGIWVKTAPDASSVIEHNSVSGNEAKSDQHGGIRCDNAMTITSTIVFANVPTDASPLCTFGESLVGVDPVFVSATDLHLRATSMVAIDQALSSSERIDFDGQARSSPRDIGADER
jgi:hypothetical protein